MGCSGWTGGSVGLGAVAERWDVCTISTIMAALLFMHLVQEHCNHLVM